MFLFYSYYYPPRFPLQISKSNKLIFLSLLKSAFVKAFLINSLLQISKSVKVILLSQLASPLVFLVQVAEVGAMVPLIVGTTVPLIGVLVPEIIVVGARVAVAIGQLFDCIQLPQQVLLLLHILHIFLVQVVAFLRVQLVRTQPEVAQFIVQYCASHPARTNSKVAELKNKKTKMAI